MLYAKVQLQSFLGSWVENFHFFTIYGHDGHLTFRIVTACTNFRSSFDRRLQMKFEENWPMCFRGIVVQKCGQSTDGRRTKSYHKSSSWAFVILSLRLRWAKTFWYFSSFLNTVDSRYLEFQGTHWNTSRYPYLDRSELREWGKQ